MKNGYFPQSENPLIKHGCVAHLLSLKSKYSVQVCSSHWEQLNEFESAVLLHSVLLVGSLDNERKNGISVGCVLWMWLHILPMLLGISVLFLLCFCGFGMFAYCLPVCDMSIVEHANANKQGITALLQASSGRSLTCAAPPLEKGNYPMVEQCPSWHGGETFWPYGQGRGKAEHCFIESVQFLLLAQGRGVLIRQPEEVQQKEEAEQERHPPGAPRRWRDRQDECGELLISHLLAQLLRLPPADPAAGLQALWEHLPQRGEPELTQCSSQPWLSAPVHRAGSPAAARPHHQRHATARGEIKSTVLCPWSLAGLLWL